MRIAVCGVLGGRFFQQPETLQATRTFVATPNDHGPDRARPRPGALRHSRRRRSGRPPGTTGGYRAFLFHVPAQVVDISMVTKAPADPMQASRRR